MDKAALIAAIVKDLESSLAVLVAAAHAARDEATDPDSRQEGKFDMRAQSAAYVAEGQARLAAELAAAVAAYRNLGIAAAPAGAGAATGTLLTLEHQGRPSVYLIGPARGGLEIEVGGTAVTVVTALSPLGRQLVGRRVGDALRMSGPRSGQIYFVVKME
jgi:transcription elongation GreA/GreB family factor